MIIFIVLLIGLGIAVNLYAKKSVDEHKGYGTQWDDEKYWNK